MNGGPRLAVGRQTPAEVQGREAPPRWPAWFAPLGFVSALIGVVVLVAIIGAIAALAGAEVDDPGPVFTLIATLVQDGTLVAVALAFAATRLRPRAWHFGLRRTRLWPAVGFTVLAIAGFYVFAAAYTALVQPEGQQRIVEELGAEESTALMVASAVLIVGIAPVAEELFFRGFFYGALRTRFGVLSAASIDGVLFGAIHYSGPETLSILPPLAFLGFAFCLLYERTGSLYPVIAFRAFNNAIALSVELGPRDGAAAWLVGLLTITTCLLAAAWQSRDTPSPFGGREPVGGGRP